MPNQHDAITSVPEFWRTLAIVAMGFVAALVISWSIDANFPHHSIDAAASVHAQV